MERNILVSIEQRMIQATARAEAAAERCEKLAALLDYTAMMADVEIPEEMDGPESMTGDETVEGE